MQNCNNSFSVKDFKILNLVLFLLSCICFHVGARTFIKSEETGMWCRGTITELIPVESKRRRKKLCGPIRYKVCDVALLEVFLIDFGSSVVLIFSGYVYGEMGFCLQLLSLLLLFKVFSEKQVLPHLHTGRYPNGSGILFIHIPLRKSGTVFKCTSVQACIL